MEPAVSYSFSSYFTKLATIYWKQAQQKLTTILADIDEFLLANVEVSNQFSAHFSDKRTD